MFAILWSPARQIRTLYAALLIILWSMYIVYDTQLILGGKNKRFQYSIDDYVMASLSWVLLCFILPYFLLF